MMVYFVCFAVGFMSKVLLDEFIIYTGEPRNVDT